MFEIGVMFWGGDDPALALAGCGQLGIGGDAALAWTRSEFRIYTVVAAFVGEDYTDVASVKRTVGFVPPGTRREREERMTAVSDFAASVGVGGIATHLGFVHEDYGAMRDLVRRVCDHAAAHGQTFALETGQEPAAMMRDFIRDVDRGNLGINFDPANMILYGTGDPIEALDVLGPYVLSVHAKDGDWPVGEGALGQERALGAGSVGMERFLRKLRETGYAGPIFVEREASDAAQRLIDMERGIALLQSISCSI